MTVLRHGEHMHEQDAEEFLKDCIRGHAFWQHPLDVIVESFEAACQLWQGLVVRFACTEEGVKSNKT